MTKSRKSAAASVDPRPIVTYAHVPLDKVDDQRGPRDLEPDVDILDAVEVPLMAQAEPLSHARSAAPDLRADPREDQFEPADDIAAAAFEPERRSWRGRVVTLVALIAIAGGAGAVAASLGVFAPTARPAAPVAVSDPVTEIIALHKQIDALGEASSPEAQARLAALSKRLAEVEQSSALVPDAAPDADAPKAVRQISLSPNGEEAAPASPVVLPRPAPRPRPQEKLASRPAAEAPLDEPAAAPAPAKAAAPQPKSATKAAPAAPAGTPAGDDNFIASVEKALADSQSKPEALQPAVPAMGRPAVSAPAGPSPLASPQAIAAPPSAGAASLPTVGDDVDPYALPAPFAKAEPLAPQPKLPPGVKLPPADIPNVPPSDQQY